MIFVFTCVAFSILQQQKILQILEIWHANLKYNLTFCNYSICIAQSITMSLTSWVFVTAVICSHFFLIFLYVCSQSMKIHWHTSDVKSVLLWILVDMLTHHLIHKREWSSNKNTHIRTGTVHSSLHILTL